MLKEERFSHILTSLRKKGKVVFDTLSAELNVSEDTIRRDIESLHKNGLLLKVRGGAIPQSKNPLNFRDRAEYFSDEKSIIGLKAQQFIKKGQTVFMDGGTTMLSIANHLSADASFRLITNNMSLVPIMSKLKGVELIILGGMYDRTLEVNTGLQVSTEAGKYIADVYFMGTCAADKDFGITAAFQSDGEIKQIMLKNALKTFAIGNSTKLNSIEHYKICELSELTGLISDLSPDHADLDHFRDLGLLLV